MKWAWSSEPALKSGRYFRTSGSPIEVPPLSAVGRGAFTDDARAGIAHSAGVSFDEPVRELSIRFPHYDLNYTLLHLSNDIEHVGLAEPHVEDTFDRFDTRAR